jgi:AraC-like DNA-binding protein
VQTLPVYYLAPPMIYFYVRSTLRDDNTLRPKDYLHFLPALIGLISVIPYIFSDFEYKVTIAQAFIDDPNNIKTVKTHWFYPNYINVIMRPILFFGYGIASMMMILIYSKKKRTYSPIIQKNKILRWLTTISVVAVMISFCYMWMTYVFFTTENFGRDSFNKLNITYITGFVYALIPLMIFIFPDILYGIPRARTLNNEKSLKSKKVVSKDKVNSETELSQFNPSEFDEDPLNEIAAMIVSYFETKKPFVKHDFSIQDLVNDLKIQKHHAYYCFNTLLNEKFTTMRTKYRVEHAKEILTNGDISINTIESMGLMSGFSSKSSFFSAFREVTGITPNEYYKEHNKNQ